MNNNQNDSGDQFQTHKDEFTVTTYQFTRNIPSLTLTKPNIKKIQEKHSLSIIKNITQQQYSKKQKIFNKKNNKNVYGNQGKIIKIGQAIFKSNFQSGNLREVEFKSPNTYKIIMDKQYNSNRTNSWFYFRCEGLKGQVNFIVSGFTKSTSLYSQGMKVCYRQINSSNSNNNNNNNNNSNNNNSNNNNNNNNKQDNENKIQWKRGCSKISYSQGYSNNSQGQQDIYQLKFTYIFKPTQPLCAVQFAYCFPYQYSKLIKLIKRLSKSTSQLSHQSLGKSYQGRDIPLLTIGNINASKSIILSARVHPGQTVASFIIQGFLKQLVSDSDFAKSLKQKYLFKIVPMINVDGVVRGHYRFSAAGYDLNRRWKHCYQTSHPEIFYLKNMIKKINRQKKVLMYIDIHGHSRKKNAFFYGCCSKQLNNFQDQPTHISKAKQFPYLMQKINQNYKYQYCTFSMSRDKQGTARISMWKQLHIDHVYTLEASLCGSSNGGNYFQDDFNKIGKSLLEGIAVYFYQKPIVQVQQSNGKGNRNSRKNNQINNNSGYNNSNNNNNKAISIPMFQKYLNILDQAKQQLKSSPYLLNMGMNQQDSGSDSQPQQGIIPQAQRQLKNIKIKNQSHSLVLPQSDNIKQKQSNIFNQNNSTYNNNKDYESTKRSIKFNLRTAPTYQKKSKISSQELKNIVDEKIQDLIDEQTQLNNNDNNNINNQKKPSKTFSNFYSYNSQHLNSLTTDSLSRRNQRVHSKSHNNNNSNNFFQKLKNPRINSQNQLFDFNHEQQQKKRIEIMNRNLLKTRQGAQYRRIKIMAEQMKRKTGYNNNIISSMDNQHNNINNINNINITPQTPPIVRGITAINNQLILTKRRVKSIAPSFYPHNNNSTSIYNKNKRFSIQNGYRNNSNRSHKISSEIGSIKLFINGDELNVKCKGSKIFM